MNTVDVKLLLTWLIGESPSSQQDPLGYVMMLWPSFIWKDAVDLQSHVTLTHEEDEMWSSRLLPGTASVSQAGWLRFR